MTAPQTRLMLADELENLRMLDARAGYAFKCADNIETIIAALRATEPARSPPGNEITPHIYSPDYQAMGDCRVCGHQQDKPWHTLPRPDRRPIEDAGGSQS